MMATLVDQYACSQILADKGYLSQKLQAHLWRQGINFWTPKRKNMKDTRIS
ncbi:IS982 family transposase, partial [Lactobacillus bombi]